MRACRSLTCWTECVVCSRVPRHARHRDDARQGKQRRGGHHRGYCRFRGRVEAEHCVSWRPYAPARRAVGGGAAGPVLARARSMFETRVGNVALLSGYAKPELASVGNVAAELLAITAVHPLREVGCSRCCRTRTRAARSSMTSYGAASCGKSGTTASASTCTARRGTRSDRPTTASPVPGNWRSTARRKTARAVPAEALTPVGRDRCSSGIRPRSSFRPGRRTRSGADTRSPRSCRPRRGRGARWPGTGRTPRGSR